MIIDEEDYLAHYGIQRKSGRYEWGSGGNVESGDDFLGLVGGLRKKGLSEAQIAEGFGISTTDLRAAKSIERNRKKQADIAFAQKLKEKGLSTSAVGRRMGINESSARALLAPGEQEKADILTSTANILKQSVDEKRYVDVGLGVEQHLGVSNDRLKVAVAMLRSEGYVLHYLKTTQLGTGKETTIKVLTPPGVTYSEVSKNRDQLKQITNFSDDNGRSWTDIQPPLSVNPDRIGIVYKEAGGGKADGVIYVRPGVKDVELGGNTYAQVRVKVGEDHYLKGMAMYKDDLPPGVDLVFNTNKSDTGNKLDAMKPISDDPDSPFGATVRQIHTIGPDGKKKVSSSMNLVNAEGDWDTWSNSLSSQMLSKQDPSLAKAQLAMTHERRVAEFERIASLTNPTVRRKLLTVFGDETDSAAVHLDAAKLPRQATKVILPITSMKPGEIYAPGFRHGERVALIRHPHGGTFEIPDLVVNNKQREATKLLGDARDAVGIHHTVAERLSGADFDGDTVLVIPNNSNKVSITPALDKLKGFDPRSEYKGYEGMPKMTGKVKQRQMGDVSNLITDMTIKAAKTEEIARAIKHSMVVIDAEKHDLDYKRSAIDNGIAQLKAKYQGGARRGASTLISRAGSEQRVTRRKERSMAKGGPIDRETGRRVYEDVGQPYVDSKGKVIVPTTKSTKLAEATDAHTLSSGTRIETIYADHSNKLKALANAARLEAINTPRSSYSPSAAKVYANEVKSLKSKYAVALYNKPLERQAQIIANAKVKALQAADPHMDADKLKKIKHREQAIARIRTGAQKTQVTIEPKEWEAIQAGAITDSNLSKILDRTDIDVVRQFATPRQELKMTQSKTTRARQMLAAGYPRAEIADHLGVSLSTLDVSVKGE